MVTVLGYDKKSINDSLVLGLGFDEMTGVVTHDRAKPYHPITLSWGPTWNSLPSGLPYLQFDGGNDYLQCPGALTVDLDVTGDFSLLAWVNPVYGVPGSSPLVVMGRNGTDVCGWIMFLFNNPTWGPLLSLRTNQGGSHSECWGAGFTGSEWQLIGYTRNQANVSAICYRNGEGLITHLGAGGMLDPVACGAAKKLLIGVQDGEAINNFKGGIAGGPCGPRAWNRELSQAEMLYPFLTERHWFGL